MDPDRRDITTRSTTMPIDPRLPISKAVDPQAGDETPEVEGHGPRGPFVEQPRDVADEASETEVEGHMPRIGRLRAGKLGEHPRDDEDPEVAGQVLKDAATDPAPDDDPEVEGHMPRVRI